MHADRLQASLPCAISPICSGWKRSLPPPMSSQCMPSSHHRDIQRHAWSQLPPPRLAYDSACAVEGRRRRGAAPGANRCGLVDCSGPSRCLSTSFVAGALARQKSPKWQIMASFTIGCAIKGAEGSSPTTPLSLLPSEGQREVHAKVWCPGRGAHISQHLLPPTHAWCVER